MTPLMCSTTIRPIFLALLLIGRFYAKAILFFFDLFNFMTILLYGELTSNFLLSVKALPGDRVR